ncbi:hypothetical protein [Caballeronia sp. SBC2]|uniref:hypothetical protein n=1 Tax=Caballeronia sp. SBC2 TaxID=2705547 RepID=UPI0019D2E272|nr:hypothetical protein [Caballeronia sp. SBC2]
MTLLITTNIETLLSFIIVYFRCGKIKNSRPGQAGVQHFSDAVRFPQKTAPCTKWQSCCWNKPGRETPAAHRKLIKQAIFFARACAIPAHLRTGNFPKPTASIN